MAYPPGPASGSFH